MSSSKPLSSTKGQWARDNDDCCTTLNTCHHPRRVGRGRSVEFNNNSCRPDTFWVFDYGVKLPCRIFVSLIQ